MIVNPKEIPCIIYSTVGKYHALLLCIFHVLQFVWRWLLNSEHGVANTDKLLLYHMFKAVLDAETKEKCQENYEILKNHPVALNVSDWALSYRLEYLTRGHNTNNYCEATMRILKERILFRTKAFSLVQFHFLATYIDRNFNRRIAAVLNNRVKNHVKSRYHIKRKKKIGENIYPVSNSESRMTCTVNTEVDICTCPVGQTGVPCKDQYAVVLQFKLSSNQFLPFSDEKAKRILYQVISDSSVELPQEWFTNLRSGPVNPFTKPATPLPEDTLSTEWENAVIPNAAAAADEQAAEASSFLSDSIQSNDEDEKTERITSIISQIFKVLKKKTRYSSYGQKGLFLP
ncbi:BRD4-interacting chromatin-remodeling complex-associated protein [Frankliniella fusca]|uniref:BRD4-interacting chromatin-remodeling complex-associated protein n=1 Tax=Frankliniella fusca TaxID=407009 RepID=A0AAE1GS14_9NEOP|nr:BRD4-interacting chromatin-remodeling complex-associated protein [Frankliniella fusca]